MRRNKNERGVNVIATVLMLITFFLVIGFGIGAMSTMNLNLAGRSVNVIKASKLADAAVASFIYHVEEVAAGQNGTVMINNLAVPSLGLISYYDGTKNVLEPLPAWVGDNCSVDVHFKNLGAGDSTFSTDNSYNNAAVAGSQPGPLVPPYTIDLVITVRVGNFTKHYQVWINRKWDFAIYNEQGPLHLLSSYNLGVTPPSPLCPSYVEGNIFSRFNPPGSSTSQYLTAYEQPGDSHHASSQNVLVVNRIPGRPYPGSVNVGGEIYVKTMVAPTVGPSIPPVGSVPPPYPPIASMDPVETCTGNTLNGRGAYGYPPPTPSPSPHLYTFPHNFNTGGRSALFNQNVTSPFANLNLIPADGIVKRINPDSYGSCLSKEKVFEDSRAGDGQILRFQGEVHSLNDPDHVSGLSFDTAGEADTYAQAQALKTSIKDDRNDKTVYYMRANLDISPPSGGAQNWGNNVQYVIRDDDGSYYPLTDIYVTAEGKWQQSTASTGGDVTVGKDEYGNDIVKHWSLDTISYKVYEEHKSHSFEGAVTMNNSLVASKEAIDFEKSVIKGDNSLLQVENSLYMASGDISAGYAVGTVIYCERIYCGAGGHFKGIMLVRDAMQVGAGMNGASMLEVQGGIAIKGYSAASGGLVATGFKVVYDPGYMQFLNRFGHFRVASWRDLE